MKSRSNKHASNLSKTLTAGVKAWGEFTTKLCHRKAYITTMFIEMYGSPLMEKNSIVTGTD